MSVHGSHTAIKRNNFDAIRLFAAFAVVVQHVTAHMDVTLLWVEPYSPWWFYDGVPLFFMISGLFVYRSAERMHDRGLKWGTFYRNRFLRVAPAIWVYLCVTVLALVVIGQLNFRDLLSAPGIGWAVSTLALAPVYSPGFLADVGTGVINGSLWTIPAEVSFYLVVPALVLIGARAGRRNLIKMLLPGGLLLAAVPVVLGGQLIDLYKVTFLPYLWYFAIGIAWHYLIERDVHPTKFAAVGGLVGYVVATTAGHLIDGPSRQWLTLLAALPLSVVMVWVGQSGPSVLERVTQKVGDLSFGVYVWHMPVVNLLLWAGLGGSLVAGAGAIAATTALGWASWHGVERPALSFKHATSRAFPNRSR